MENSDDDPFSFYQFQEDDIDIACPDITTWDDVINRIPYLTPENVQAVDFRDHHRVDRKGKQPKKSTEDTSHVAQKKLMHRDIEKLRRKEMATLYADLRSVVPARFLKGKRSVSDQIHEAKTYIECLQRDVRALGAKRDDIKVMSTKDDQGAGRCSRSSSSMASNFSVSVEPCSVGVEVVISGELTMLADGRQLALPVSRVLKLMSEEGLAVVCCNWTNSDGRLHYVIQSEVLGYVDVDFPTLQRKLYGMINGLIDIKRT